MIEGYQYIVSVKLFFAFLETEFGFRQAGETVNGNAFYDVEFRDAQRVISISYENIADHLEVIVFMLQNGNMPKYDDKAHTIHLEHLNKRITSEVKTHDIESNSEYFSRFEIKNELDRVLLKKARELRLYLTHNSRERDEKHIG